MADYFEIQAFLINGTQRNIVIDVKTILKYGKKSQSVARYHR